MKVDTKEKDTKRKLSPLVGESVSGADERGKCEQKCKNKKISVSRTHKNDFNLCTPTRPYRLASSALPSAFGESNG